MVKTSIYRSFPIKFINEHARFGRVHAIAKKGKAWIGAADPDWEGTTAYFPSNEEQLSILITIVCFSFSNAQKKNAF